MNKRTRTYSMLASRPGGYMNWPGRYYTSNLRIRATAVMLFRKWFGREPTSSYGIDGNLAYVSDERGNRIELDQMNYLEEYWPIRKSPFPKGTCLAIVKYQEAA